MVHKACLRNLETGRFWINPFLQSQASRNYKKDIRNNNQQTGNYYQPTGRKIRFTKKRVKTARAKKFHKLGFNTKESLEDWQRTDVPQGIGKLEGGERGNRKNTKKNTCNTVPKELQQKQLKNICKKKPQIISGRKFLKSAWKEKILTYGRRKMSSCTAQYNQNMPQLATATAGESKMCGS